MHSISNGMLTNNWKVRIVAMHGTYSVCNEDGETCTWKSEKLKKTVNHSVIRKGMLDTHAH